MRSFLLAALVVSSSTLAAAPPAPTHLSVEFQRADVHSVLRMFSELGHFNLVTTEDVAGLVTLKLRNVSVDVAFKAVLRSMNLGVERTDSIVRIAPLARLASEAEQRVRLREAERNARPLTTRIVPVNYATAADMATLVRPLLSPRGSISVDARTNSLIIRDVE